MGVSVINLLIGIWLIISTFVVPAFNNLETARWNNVIVGILIAFFSLVRGSTDQRAYWSWFNVILGAWLIISPFALGFTHMAGAVWHNVILGIVVAALAWGRARMLVPARAT